MNTDWLKCWTENFPPKFASANTLRGNGVLGMNERNHSFIHQYNDRKLYPNVDDKLKTKRLALRCKIPTPNLIGTVQYQHQVKKRGTKHIFGQTKHLHGQIHSRRGNQKAGVLQSTWSHLKYVLDYALLSVSSVQIPRPVVTRIAQVYEVAIHMISVSYFWIVQPSEFVRPAIMSS